MCGALVNGLILNPDILQSSIWPWLPNLLYGVFCILAAIMTLGLAETLGRDLPETLEDVGRKTK